MDRLTPSTSSLHIPVSLEEVLRPHQIDVLHFLWHRLVDEGLFRKSSGSGLMKKLYDSQLGAIIGHSMGLGKTLSALSFLVLLQQNLQDRAKEEEDGADNAPCCPGLRAIIICPKSCVEFWREAYVTWMQPEYFGDGPLPQMLVPRDYSNVSRAEYYIKEEYYTKGGILVVGYEEYLQWMKQAEGPRRLSSTRRVHSLLDGLRGGGVGSTGAQCLLLEVLESADIVIFDEAHRLRNERSFTVQQITRHVRRVPLRLALTGTPLQNHLEAYMVMHSVITGDLFDKRRFRSTFVLPISRGQCSDSTYHQFLEMQKCVSSLRSFFTQYVHHCGAEVLEGFLPHRSEFIVFTTLSTTQDALYKRVLQDFASQSNESNFMRCTLMLHQLLSHLCLHPCLLRHYSNDVNNSGSTGLAQEEGAVGRSVARPPPLLAEEEDWAAAFSGDDDKVEYNDQEHQEEEEGEEEEEDMEESTALRNVEGAIDVSESPKLQFILNLTEHIIHTKKEKVVIFSHYVSHLLLLQHVLRTQLQVAADIFCGTSSSAQRCAAIQRFNDEEERRVLLCSIRAGGVGINLCVANHCILADVSWNPTDDTQATYRIYRFGQTRPVNIYRLATFGTTEHVVFSYALGKAWLHRKVADISDPRRQQRHMAESYYKYPCQVPIDGDRSFPSAEEREAHVMGFCEEHCPDLGTVFHRHPDLHAHVRCVLLHTFLLKDDEQESTAEMEQKFSMQKDKTERVPIVLYEKRTLSSSSSHKKLIDSSEEKLLHFAQRVVQVLTSVLLEHAHGEHDTAEEAAARLAHMLFSLTRIQLDDLQQRHPHALNLEYVLRVYARGVDDLFRDKLNTVDFADMRAHLLAHVQETHSKCSSSRRDRPVLADLLSAVKLRPFSLLSRFAASEITFIETELGFSRPFAIETFMRGLRSYLYAERDSPERPGRLREMALLLCDDVDTSADAYLTAEGCAEKVFNALEAKFDVIWPAYGGFDLPPLPMDIEEEERNMRRAYVTAYSPLGTGLFDIEDAAAVLHLRLFATTTAQRRSFFCKRCPNSVLQQIDAKARDGLRCPRCGYNVQFEMGQHVSCHHPAQLFQLSSTCNKVCGFSLHRAMRVRPPPEAATNVVALADWLTQKAPTDEPPLPFVSTCMQHGVDALLTQFPSSAVFHLSLQCGTGYDLPLLRRLLLSNAHLLWSSQLRKHVKGELASLFKQTMASAHSSHASLVGMPVVLLLLALYSGATAGQLSRSSQLLEQERCDTSIHCALLRYAADTLVRLLYLEELQRFVRTASSPSVSRPPSLDSVLSDRILENIVVEEEQAVEAQRAGSPFPDRKRVRSPTPCSPQDSFSSSGGSRSGSSSFGLRYSADRSSFASDVSRHSEEEEGATAEQWNAEAVLPPSPDQLRMFWGAFAAVYGMGAVEAGAQMAEALPLPPDGVQPTSLPVGTVNAGMKVTEMLDLFFTKLLGLHTLVPLMMS